MAKTNVVLISIDALRGDCTDFPVMDQFKKEGVYFEKCISVAPTTPVSHTTMLTGVNSYTHGVRHLFKESKREDIPTIARMLKKYGFNTGGFPSAPPLGKHVGLDKDFDIYDDNFDVVIKKTHPGLTQSYRAAPDTNAVVLKWIKEECVSKKIPFFVFIHYFDAHWPHEPIKGFEPKGKTERDLYLAEVNYVDYHIGKLVGEIKELGVFEDTLLLITSDHGTDLGGLGDHGGPGSKHPEEFNHGMLLYDTTQASFLIIRFPDNLVKNMGVEKLIGLSIKNQIRECDIVPTILDIIGVSKAQWPDFQGISLIPLIKGKETRKFIAYSETFYPLEKAEEVKKEPVKGTYNMEAIRWADKFKLIYSVNENDKLCDGVLELYNLEKDPEEKNNLVKE